MTLKNIFIVFEILFNFSIDRQSTEVFETLIQELVDYT